MLSILKESQWWGKVICHSFSMFDVEFIPQKEPVWRQELLPTTAL